MTWMSFLVCILLSRSDQSSSTSNTSLWKVHNRLELNDHYNETSYFDEFVSKEIDLVHYEEENDDKGVLFQRQEREINNLTIEDDTMLRFVQNNKPDDWSYAYAVNMQEVVKNKMEDRAVRKDLLSCCLNQDAEGNLEMKNFSLSVRLSITSFPINGKPAMFSYALDTIDNAFMIGVLPDMITIQYLYIIGSVKLKVEPRRWHHLLISIVSGVGTVFWDGLHAAILKFENKGLSMNGYLVLGQEQDSPLGDFVKEQMFHGFLSEFMILKSVSPKTVEKITSCEAEAIPQENYIVKWSELQWSYGGDVLKSRNKICLHELSLTVIIPRSVTFQKWEIDCNLLNFTNYVPKSYVETAIIGKSTSRLEQCDNFYHNDRLAWVELKFDQSSSTWMTPDGEGISDNIKFGLNPNCYTHIVLKSGRELLQPVSNDTVACSVCQAPYPDYPYYLEGFCDDYVDSVSSFYIRNSGKGLSFHNSYGFGLHMIGNIWIFYHAETNKTLATYDGDAIPIGTKKWQMLIPIVPCSDFLEYFNARSNKVFSNSKMLTSISFSNCPRDYFTCADGNCIPIEYKCSHTTECDDGSDEESCFPIKTGNTYDKQIAPAQFPFELKVAPIIEQIFEVKTKSQMIRINGRLIFEWRDFRLQCLNLNSNPRQNSIENVTGSTLWIPKFQIQNAESLLGIKFSNKLLNLRPIGDPVRKLDDLVYDGEHCDIIYFVKFSTNIHCRFDLRMFPFDYQYCKIQVQLDNVPDSHLKLELYQEYEQEKIDDPPEFQVTSMNITLKNTSDTFNVSFVLKRYTSFSLFGTYFPTFLLHVIGYGTLNIPARDFQDRGTMSLTTLLVLISLYTETQNSLPITSYIKAVDIWFIFSITFLSLIIATHLYTSDSEDGTTSLFFKVKPFAASKEIPKIPQSKEERCQKIINRSKKMLTIFYYGFLILYWTYVFVF